MTQIERYKQNKLISKISVDYNIMHDNVYYIDPW